MVERFLDTEEVGGSIPPAPTSPRGLAEPDGGTTSDLNAAELQVMSTDSPVEPLDATGPSGESQAGRFPARDLPPLVRAPAGGGGDRAVSRTRSAASARRPTTASSTTSCQPAVHARGPRRHREADGAHRQAEPPDRAEAAAEGRGAGAVRDEGPDAQVRADPREGRASRSSATRWASSSTSASARTCRRPARSRPSSSSREPAGRLLEGQGRQPVDAAHLRHALLHEGGARRSTCSARGGQEARPPQARAASWTCSRSPTRPAPA